MFRRGSNDVGDYDFNRLRVDLVDELGAQCAAFSGGVGFLEMYDAEDVSNKQLLEMARKEGFNLNKYKR